MTPNPQDSAVALEVERAAFEACLKSMPEWEPEFEVHRAWVEQFAWFAWQARASQSYGTSGVPEGWKLVPVEPTVEMLSAGAECWHISKDNADGYYRAMLAAAPNQGENHVG